MVVWQIYLFLRISLLSETKPFGILGKFEMGREGERLYSGHWETIRIRYIL